MIALLSVLVSMCALLLIPMAWCESSDSLQIHFSVQEIAAISHISLALPVAAAEAGLDPSVTTMVKYTSVVATGRSHRLEAWLTGQLPPGVSVVLDARPAQVAGGGSALGPVTLKGEPTTVVQGIGNCATGTAPADGARITVTIRGVSGDGLPLAGCGVMLRMVGTD